MFHAMDGLISAGLASLVIQSRVFFTILLAVVLNGERLRPPAIVALLLALSGMALLVARADGGTTLVGLAMVIAAGLCWASGNHMARTIDKDHVLGLTIWACLFATPLLGISALLIEGPGVIERSLASASVGAWFAVVWQSVGNTLFGYGLWAWLLSRHPAATVAPLAMLVPVFGIGTAAIVLAEPLPFWKLGAAGLVLGGLVVNVIATRWSDRRVREDVLGEPV